MVRILFRAALLALLFPAVSWALGVGEIEVRSKLNEPLRAEIELIYGDTAEAQGAEVRLATPEDFARVGLDRDLVGMALAFEVIRNDQGNYVITVSSREPVTETFLDFLIEVEWEAGRLLREYVVLLDPPVAPPSPVQVTPLPATAPPEPMMPASGTASAPASTPSGSGRRSPGGSQDYGPVGRGETLWEIARDWRPSDAVTINQTMVAILRMNPEAFYEENVNALREGAVLRLPSESDVRGVATARANETVLAHNELFGAYASSRAGTRVPTVSDAGAEATYGGDARDARAPSTSSRLELVPPGADDRSLADRPGSAADAAEAARMREDLARVREDLLSARQENDDLQGRVSELEGLVTTMERAISLKDADLADLEAELRAAREAELAALSAADERSASSTFDAPVAAEPAMPTAPETQVPAGAAPTPPAAEPIPAPAAPVDEPGLFSNPLVIGGGLLVLLGLGGLGFMLSRRGSDDPSSGGADELFAGAPSAEPDAPPSVAVNEPMPGPDELAAQLRTQLEEDPDNAQLHLRLLRQHYAEGNEGAFVDAAKAMKARIGDSHPAWMEVRSMGAKIAPAVALFAVDADGDDGDDGAATRIMETPPPAPALDPAPAASEGLELEGDADAEPAPGADDGYRTAEIPAQLVDDPDSFDFELDLDEAEGDDDLDLDLDLDDLDLGLDDDDEDGGTGGGDDDLSLDFELDEPDRPDATGLSLDDGKDEIAAAIDASEDDDLSLDFELSDTDLGEPSPDESDSEPVADATGDDDFSFDFDLEDLPGLDGDSDEAATGDGEVSAVDEAARAASDTDAELAQAIDDLGLDFADLGADDAEPAESDASKDSAFDGDRTDFELEAVDFDAATPSVGERDTAEMELGSANDGADDESVEAGEASGEVVDLDDLELSDTDLFGPDESAGTKLDLARAYVEMGDPEGARGMLEEVLAEGSDEQKAEAQGILDGLEE